jgi:hypothetical protein
MSPPSSPATPLRAVLAVAVALASSGVAARARAAFAPVTPRPNLEIVIIAPAGASDLLSVAIAPLMTELEPIAWRQLRDTTPVSEVRFEPHAGVVRLWIDAHHAGTVAVVGFSRRGVPRVRTVEAQELTPVAAETIGQIVRETAVALLADPAGQDSAVQETDAETAESKPVRRKPVRVVVEDAPRAEEPAQPTPPTTVAGVMGSLAFGYLLRSMDSFTGDTGTGLTISATAWLERDTVRWFARLSFDQLQASGLGATLYETSIIPTFGISWRPEASVDFRTALGVGADRINNFAIEWYPVARGVGTVGVLLPHRLELMFEAMLDIVSSSEFRRQAWQPAAMVGFGWRP